LRQRTGPDSMALSPADVRGTLPGRQRSPCRRAPPRSSRSRCRPGIRRRWPTGRGISSSARIGPSRSTCRSRRGGNEHRDSPIGPQRGGFDDLHLEARRHGLAQGRRLRRKRVEYHVTAGNQMPRRLFGNAPDELLMEPHDGPRHDPAAVPLHPRDPAHQILRDVGQGRVRPNVVRRVERDQIEPPLHRVQQIGRIAREAHTVADGVLPGRAHGGGGYVRRHHVDARLRQNDREEARARAQIEHALPRAHPLGNHPGKRTRIGAGGRDPWRSTDPYRGGVGRNVVRELPRCHHDLIAGRHAMHANPPAHGTKPPRTCAAIDRRMRRP